MRLIDADDLIKSIDYSADLGGALGKVVEVVKSYAKFMVQTAPTIKEQKTGRWVNANEDKWNTVEVLKCSSCGEMDNRMYRTDNYCPNCGARMECEEE